MTRKNLGSRSRLRALAVLAGLAAMGATVLLMPVGSASAAARDAVPPKVVSVSPAAGATGASVSAEATVTFSERMNPKTIRGKTFGLFDNSGASVARVGASVRCGTPCRTATVRPTSNLKPATPYVAVVRGGGHGVKDLAGNALAKSERWSFSTTSSVTPAADVTRPTISIASPAGGATYALNQEVKADYACRDDEEGASGLKSCEGTVADGAPVDTATSGQKSFTVEATDNAGNASSVTRTYTVSECTILGTEGTDALTGTAGDDVICGMGGNDTIKGSEGDDILRGGDGHDRLYGGADDDTLDGGLGTDSASFSGSSSGIIASLTTNTAQGEGSDTLLGVENLIGSRYADELTGSARTEYLHGASGADTLSGLGGADTLSGAYGDDQVRGATGNDKLKGGPGADDLFGEEDNDAINSEDGVSGNDSLDGGAGADTMMTDAREASIVNIP